MWQPGLRWLFVLLSLVACQLAGAASDAALARCAASPLATPVLQQVLVTATGDSALITDSRWADYRVGQVSVRFQAQCLIALTYASKNPHFGLVAIVDRAGAVQYADTTKRAPTALAATARGRPVFVYNDGWGSGWWSERAVALLPLAVDQWVETVDVPVVRRVYPAGGPAAAKHEQLAGFEQAGQIAVRGDTLFVRRQVTTTYADPRVRLDSAVLSEARIEVP